MLYRTFVVGLWLAAALIAGATLASTPEDLAAAARALPDYLAKPDAVWEAEEERGGAPRYDIPLALPAAGYSGAFAEAVYGLGRSAFSLSTNLAVLAAPGAPEAGQRPAGTPGVCAQAPAR